MLTTEDLQAIVKAIHPIIKTETDALRKDITLQIETAVKREGEKTRNSLKQYIEANNRIIGTLFKVELAATTREIVTVLKNHEQRLQALEDPKLSRN
jgi:hypothetical protein